MYNFRSKNLSIDASKVYTAQKDEMKCLQKMKLAHTK